MNLTGRPIAAAHALLGMSQSDLAERSNLSVATTKRMEGSAGAALGMVNNLAALRFALDAAGVEFIPENGGGVGVRLREGGQGS